MQQTITYECGHTETVTAPETFFRRCRACQDAWVAERTPASDQDALDTIFATDSSDDARQPAPQTEAQGAAVAQVHQELQQRAADQRAWAEQEAWENA